MQQLPHNDFAIGWPAGWIDSSTVSLIQPKEDGFRPNLNITRQLLEKPCSVQEYSNQQDKSLSKQLESKGYRILEKGPTTLGGMKAYQRRQTFVIPNANIQVVQLQVHVIRDNCVYVVTASDKASTFEKNLPIFNAALAQFKFRASA